jgi:glycosyltransferase involved in cell wall biosynthesis
MVGKERPVIDVIIPARNEADTIGPIVEAFRKTETIGDIFVIANGSHSEATADVASAFGATVSVYNQSEGKGQAIATGLQMVATPNVILCDGDLRGFTSDHVRQFAHGARMQIVGVPDWPGLSPVPWPVRMDVFAQMAGQRCLPADVVRSVPLYGYTVEAFLNRAAEQAGLLTAYVRLEGVIGKIRNNQVRMDELRRDREWLAKNW